MTDVLQVDFFFLILMKVKVIKIQHLLNFLLLYRSLDMQRPHETAPSGQSPLKTLE